MTKVFDAKKAPWKKGRNGKGQFKKGSTPHNKGKKIEDYMPEESLNKIKSTQFTKENKGVKHSRHLDIGTERHSKDGIKVKVTEGGKESWRFKHHLEWEKHNGPIPDGHVVIALDGDKANYSIDNLMLVSKGDLMKVNHQKSLTEDPELNKAIVNTTKLDTQIKEKRKTEKTKVERDIEIIDQNIENIKKDLEERFWVIGDLSKKYGVYRGTLSKRLREKYPEVYDMKKGKGFYARRFAEENKEQIIHWVNNSQMKWDEHAKKINVSTQFLREQVCKIVPEARKLKKREWWKPVKDLEINEDTLFKDYYVWWCFEYKVGKVADATATRYRISAQAIRALCPDEKIKDMTRRRYQKLVDDYGATRSKNTLLDFKNSVNKSLRDLVYDGILEKDPTYDIQMNPMVEPPKRTKFISEHEMQKLLNSLDLSMNLTEKNQFDWLVFLLAKTGARFAEGLGITKADFDFEKNILSINKSFLYKENRLGKTKNASSVRDIYIDSQTSKVFRALTNNKEEDELLFVPKGKRIFNSTVNNFLKSKCEEAGITKITVHVLRHSHASILLAKGTPMMYVSKRLGHSDTTMTRKIYAHVTDEMEAESVDMIEKILGGGSND